MDATMGEHAVGAPTIAMHVVYALVFLPLDLIVYVGSTERALNFERRDEHTRLCGGARRVTIAFAQRCFQPVLKFFEFRELWRGECTTEQVRGIEQHFIVKYETRSSRPRSREACTAHDTDLMEPNAVPKQLNINNACSDPSMVAWATRRVEHDSGLTVHLSPMEKLCTSHLFEMVRIEIESAVELTAPLVVNRCIAKYVAMPPAVRLGATEVHTDFNRVYAALRDDDGQDALRCCRAKMKTFNIDHHPDETWSAACVLAEIRVVEAALGMPRPRSTYEADLPPDKRPDDETSFSEQAATKRNSWTGWALPTTEVNYITLSWTSRVVRFSEKEQIVDVLDILNNIYGSSNSASVAASKYFAKGPNVLRTAGLMGIAPDDFVFKVKWSDSPRARLALSVGDMYRFLTKVVSVLLKALDLASILKMKIRTADEMGMVEKASSLKRKLEEVLSV